MDIRQPEGHVRFGPTAAVRNYGQVLKRLFAGPSALYPRGRGQLGEPRTPRLFHKMDLHLTDAPGQNISADYLSNIWQSDCCTNWQLKQKRIFVSPGASIIEIFTARFGQTLS
jgi:hypothetical protein